MDDQGHKTRHKQALSKINDQAKEYWIRFIQSNLNLYNLKILYFICLIFLGVISVRLYSYCFVNNYILIIRVSFAIVIFL